MDRLIELYKRWSGEAPANIQKLPAAGSNREYYRLADSEGNTVVGVIGTSRDEDHAFVYLCNHFARRKLPVPHVLAVSDDELRYLQTDLGSVSLFDAIEGGRQAGGRYNVTERELLVKAIREVDTNHIILLGAAQWNSNFAVFHDASYDDKIMYTCHRYGGDATAEAIHSYIAFRDSVNLPMYMGEIGHNTMEWQASFREVMEANNIGWTFWPYKKKDDSCMMGIRMPENWGKVVAFSEAPRGTYSEIRNARPDQGVVRQAMLDFIQNCRIENCIPQTDYIQSLGLEAK